MRSHVLVLSALVSLSLAFVAGCGPKYPKCSKDDHCSDKGEVCVDGTCQQCRDNTNCPEGQQCQGGRCEAKPECAADGDCSNNQVCRSGKCQTECTADGDCGAGMKCANNRCVDKLACAGPSDCEGGFECRSGRCSRIENVGRDMCTMPTVNFGFNEATLTPDARKALSDIAECLKIKGGTITIEGHADERGTEEYNLALGDRRASTVEKYLVTMGVPASKLRSLSKGELEPVDNRSNEEAWAKNRRAEFEER
jgi:peptidoglycan-associated lipoprotein